MIKLTPGALLTAIRSRASYFIPLFAFAIAAGPLAAQSGAPTGYASVRGFVADSVRGGALSGAFIDLVPTGRQVRTNDRGEFTFDSIPAGNGYKIRVVHAMLDTIGIALATPVFALKAGDALDFTLAVPSAPRLVSMFCPPEMRARGASALVGFVRDPDTGAPIDSVTVSLVYDDDLGGFAKRPVNRVARLDSTGRYKICGLPAHMTGRVQMIRNGTQSPDIPVKTDASSPLALRSLGMSLSTQHIAAGRDSGGKAIRILRGPAKVTGRVMSQAGTPIAGARVQMDETAAAAVTGADGRFTLDSVPTGTQSLSVRKLGYNVTDKAVEVSLNMASPISVVMENYIPMLAPVVSVAQRDIDEEKIGFTRRKRQGIGIYREGDQIPRGTSSLATALASVPGIKIERSTAGGVEGLHITGAGGPNACMNFVVDGMPWREDAGGGGQSIADYVRPEELQALELYSASTVPPEFNLNSMSNCQVLVLWTSRRIRSGTSKVKPPL
jgi:hypothetical protein